MTWAVAGRIGADRWWKLGVSVGTGEVVFAALVLLAGLSREERAPSPGVRIAGAAGPPAIGPRFRCEKLRLE